MLTPRLDGGLDAASPVLLPVMAPRLQADCQPDGLIDLSLWGVGRLAKVRFAPLDGPFVYRPNNVEARGGGIYVAQSAPVILLRGTRALRIYPARRCANWHDVSAEAARPAAARHADGETIELPWGAIRTSQRGDDLLVAVGGAVAEAEAALRLPVDQIIAEARDYIARCDLMPEADPILRSMVVQGIHAALSSIRQDEQGRFAGLAAGQAYSAPARTYFRDGYWTLQPLLELAPEAVRDQIRILARGVQPDGEAPSGVILSGGAQSAAWREYITHPDRFKEHHLRPEDWWSDHFDSPLFFILAIGDYVRATGDRAEAERHWPLVKTIIERYWRLAGPDGVLPLKPHNDRDWADNVFREGLVSYDIGLWIGALDAVAELGKAIDPTLAEVAVRRAKAGRAAIDKALWQPSRRAYADFAAPDGFIEDHVMIDTLTLSRYDAISEGRAVELLETMRQLLESRHNTEQPYGDWGVLCAYPPYKRPGDVRAKTAFAFRYHNGSDWPYWDGVYADERLRRGLGGARYALTRWWQYCLEQGWAGAVEYFAPPFGRGSLLQGWSAMPAAIALKYGAEALDAPTLPLRAEARR